MTVDRHVLVTGATGFLGSHLVRELLARGYRVRGTVRSTARTAAYAHLIGLPGASYGLDLVEADLTEPDSFVDAMAGITDVMHAASPYILDTADPQRDLVDPAVNGTLAVLDACARAGTVRRMVLTSSVAAITDQPDSTHVLTEADWNTSSTLRRNPYYLSKAAAERAAWDFMGQAGRGFDLVSVNPFLNIGPELGPGVNTSNQILVDLTAGAYPAILALAWGFVDVRDVAVAHALAMETPDASGRYLCAGEVLTMREVIGVMREHLPLSVRLPSRPMDNAIGTAVAKAASWFQPDGAGSYLRTHLGRVPQYDTARIRSELGMTFRPVRESVADTVIDLVSRGKIAVPDDGVTRAGG